MSTIHVEFLLTVTLALKDRSNLSGVYYKLEKNPRLDNIRLGNFRMRLILFILLFPSTQKLREYRVLEQHCYFCDWWDFLQQGALHSQRVLDPHCGQCRWTGKQQLELPSLQRDKTLQAAPG